MKHVILCIILLLQDARTQKTEGDTCTEEYTNSVGLCTRAETCRSANQAYQQNGIRPTICAYTPRSVLVCCRDGASILQTPAPTRPPPVDSPPVWGSSGEQSDGGRVSERKCKEYSRGVVQTVGFIPLVPLPPSHSLQSAKCDYVKVELIVGGQNASLGEFPHMAALGWVNGDGGYDFNCGGSLISDRFVLTAAHCASDVRAQVKVPSIVRLGDQNIDSSVQDGASPIDVPIKTIHKHPKYKSPLRYDDIALVEMNAPVDFRKHVRPACLWTDLGFGSETKAIATGWGVTDSRTQIKSKELQKVSLSLLQNDYCDNLLSSSRNRNWMGFQDGQMCAGELRGGKDTCQGDSGSPLVVAAKENQCVFRVVGVTSFGKKCAQSGTPSIYTRVAKYLDWIESVVWPGE